MRRIVLSAVVACALLGGCKDIDRFSTDPSESYCGRIVSASIVRSSSLSMSVCLRMTLDAEQVTSTPGALWTDDGMFAATPLRPIPQVSHDPLLTLSFGEGRDKNFLFAIDPVDPASGSSIMAVVSLMHSGDTEVRLIRGAPSGISALPTVDGGTARDGSPIFGVFAPLKRQKGTCREEPGCAWPPE